jgi:hypothetical protein
MKKGQGLSMNVIIIAAISLLVLVIISVLVLRAGNNVNENTGCTGVNGVCIDSSMSCGDYGQLQGKSYMYDPAHGCGVETQICCIPI